MDELFRDQQPALDGLFSNAALSPSEHVERALQRMAFTLDAVDRVFDAITAREKADSDAPE